MLLLLFFFFSSIHHRLVCNAVEHIDTVAAFGIPQQLWRCGVAYSSADDAILQVNNSCPRAAAEINHCCVVHDNCYQNQLVRKQCDSQLCKCLKYQVLSNVEAEKCLTVGKSMCRRVELYDDSVYNRSAINGAEKIDTIHPLELGDVVQEHYMKMYAKCESQAVTFSSCALVFKLCHRNPHKSKRMCLLNLARCIVFTQNDRQYDRECELAVDTLLLDLIKTEDQLIGSIVFMDQTLIANNATFIKRIYLQIVSGTRYYSWILGFFLFYTICISCMICINGIINSTNARQQVTPNDDIIRVHVTSSTNDSSRDSTSTSSTKALSASEVSKK